MPKILLVDDDLDICEIIKLNLNGYNYELFVANNAQEALKIINNGAIDLVLLDIMLPDLDGVNFCGNLRKITNCPVIFISCIDDDNTIIRALEMGGDDYLVKPFNSNILIARIEANLRRVNMIEENLISNSEYQFGDCTIEINDHTVLKKGEKIYLSPIEIKILLFMVDNPNRILSLDEIYDNIWTTPSYGDVRTVKVHVSNLRKKVEDDPSTPKYIKTIRRTGYFFTLE